MFKKLKSIFSSNEEAQKEAVETLDKQQDSVAGDVSEVASDASAQHTAEKDERVDVQLSGQASEQIVVPATDNSSVVVVTEPEPAKKGMFSRMKAGLSRTKANLSEKLGNLFLGKKEIDDELLEDIETLLLTADVGVEATTEIIGRLTDRVARNQLADAQALHESLKQELAGLLAQVEQPLVIDAENKPYVILMVGVNGVGKTTTIGKLTKRFQAQGKSVMLAAGDTFRAAAIEQLQVWGDRNNVPVVAQHTGADCASVLFDA